MVKREFCRQNFLDVPSAVLDAMPLHVDVLQACVKQKMGLKITGVEILINCHFYTTWLKRDFDFYVKNVEDLQENYQKFILM